MYESEKQKMNYHFDPPFGGEKSHDDVQHVS